MARYVITDIDNEDVLPRLWIFLLVLLVTLVSGVALSAVTTRVIQRRRRQDLQRRIAAGEVDLEMLHVKQLNVPQRTLDKMPLYTYDRGGEPGPMAPKPNSNSTPRGSGEESSKRCEAHDSGRQHVRSVNLDSCRLTRLLSDSMQILDLQHVSSG